MGGNAKMKKIELLSYQYPDLIKILIGPYVYTYRASEVICRRFMNGLNYGLGFHSLAWFKRKAELVKREKEKVIPFVDEPGEVSREAWERLGKRK